MTANLYLRFHKENWWLYTFLCRLSECCSGAMEHVGSPWEWVI